MELKERQIKIESNIAKTTNDPNVNDNANNRNNRKKYSKESAISLSNAITLCQGSRGIGPGRCYTESANLGDEMERVQLCQGSSGVGPAVCLRKSKSVFKPEYSAGRTGRDEDEANISVLRWALCSGAASAAPAECVLAAPHYLGNEEKLVLCSHSKGGAAQDPSKCLLSEDPEPIPSTTYARSLPSTVP